MQIDPAVASAKPAAASRPPAPELPRQPRHPHPRLRARRRPHGRAGRLPRDLRLHPLQALRPARPRPRALRVGARGRRRARRHGREQMNGVPLIFGKRDDGTRYVQRIPFASLQSERPPRVPPGSALPRHPDVAGPGFRIGEDERDGMVVNRFRNEPGRQVQAPRLAHRQPARSLLPREAAPLPQRRLLFHRLARSRSAACACSRARTTSRSGRCSPARSTSSTTSPIPTSWPSTAEAGDLTIHDGRIWHRTALATAQGDASERCVSYLPLMEGPLKPKHEENATPFYFRLKSLVGY